MRSPATVVLVLALVVAPSAAFSSLARPRTWAQAPGRPVAVEGAAPITTVLRSTEDGGDDDAPSDVDDSALEAADEADTEFGDAEEEPMTEDELTEAVRERRGLLLSLGAATARGEAATPSEKLDARLAVEFLEREVPAEAITDACKGTWELVYSSTQLFRSSPFFMAGRAVCNDGAEADRFNWFCDMHRAALAISTIQRVRQVVSDTKIVSEFEVAAGAVPFVGEYFNLKYSGGLPVAITGSIVSSADIDEVDGTTWRLLMDTVEIKGSNVPGLRQLLDNGLKLESRALGGVLEDNLPGYTNPRPAFRVTYVDSDLRVSRDQDNNIFVYFRSSPNEHPKDYATEPADLGFAQLLRGIQRAVLPQGSSL